MARLSVLWHTEQAHTRLILLWVLMRGAPVARGSDDAYRWPDDGHRSTPPKSARRSVLPSTNNCSSSLGSSFVIFLLFNILTTSCPSPRI
ncbi:hypothetical protein BJ912DRAFT_102352 [Pholiota molesta]|nr:hypothetical protein BJ912DRAFT_102352 [Pholiota molesta]